MPVKLLFIGDIIGKPGRQVLSRELHRLVDRYFIDVVIANGENSAGGFGITEEVSQELIKAGVHLITSGNHVWDKKDCVDFLEKSTLLVRPANYPEGTPGRGAAIVATPGGTKVAVLNLEGRVFMNNLDCPFRTADREIARLREITPVILVDFHAEASSEKGALGWYLDGRVSAVVGTHTHVQTQMRHSFDGKPHYDVGMTGASIPCSHEKDEQSGNSYQLRRGSRCKKDLRLNVLS